ncbi:hypothetical protein [Merismopedia glauca]|uniref:Uncharacterized protein n=1 Tax=Merismopedia glauca CCAP 1448/3 TaxID=1296344 RepID=A0A2T1C2A0_9CYAN|nr:hypothetical protein [Merismopedia glauca]PSB02391.1 hypothetical protein C7B64_13475 [Merismopedia glauca CCAP 1448/3]
MKTIRSNSTLRHKSRIIIFHPTTALAILLIGAVILISFSILELSPYVGWFLFVALSFSVYVMAPNGLGDVIARMVKPPKLTRGCNLYESPMWESGVRSQESGVKKEERRDLPLSVQKLRKRS